MKNHAPGLFTADPQGKVFAPHHCDHRGHKPRLFRGRSETLRRTIVLVSAGILLAGAVAAAPAATAGSPTAAASRSGQPRSITVPASVGEVIAAANARKEGIDWADCPAGWGLAAPVQCGWVTVPIDYTKPFGDTIKLAVDRAVAKGTPAER